MPRLPAPRGPNFPPRAVLPAAVALVAAASACGGDLLEATSRNNINPLAFARVVYPFSTATGSLPTALAVGDPSLLNVEAVRPSVVARSTATGVTVLVPNFDFAFDVGTGGQIRLIPSKLLAGLTTTGRQLRTSVRVVDTPFDSLNAAPTGDYQGDSATTVRVGQTLVLDLEKATCLGSSRPSVFAKLVVDSVSPTTGGVYVRGVLDPNCGYRALKLGERPTS